MKNSTNEWKVVDEKNGVEYVKSGVSAVQEGVPLSKLGMYLGILEDLALSACFTINLPNQEYSKERLIIGFASLRDSCTFLENEIGTIEQGYITNYSYERFCSLCINSVIARLLHYCRDTSEENGNALKEGIYVLRIVVEKLMDNYDIDERDIARYKGENK